MDDDDLGLRHRLETHPAVSNAGRLGSPGYALPRLAGMKTVEVDAAGIEVLERVGVHVVGAPGAGNCVAFDAQSSNTDIVVHFNGYTDNLIVMEKTNELKGQIHCRGDGHLAMLGGGWLNIQVDFIHDRSCLYIGSRASIGQAYFWIEGEGRSLMVGEDGLMAWGVGLRTGDAHGLIDIAAAKVTNLPQDVFVGAHVWLAQDVLVSKGVTIGRGSAVGSRGVVTRDLPGCCVAAGVPAKPLRRGVTWCHPNRPDQAQIDDVIAAWTADTPS